MDSLACHVEVYVDGKTTNDNTHDTLTARKVVKFKEGILRDTTFHHMELLLHCLEDFISHSVTQSGIWARGGMGSEMQWTEGKKGIQQCHTNASLLTTGPAHFPHKSRFQFHPIRAYFPL